MAENKIMQEKNMQTVSIRQKIMHFVVMFAIYAFLIAIAIIVLFPFYWMIISSLKTLEEYRLSVPTFWPKRIMLSNYADAFTTASLGRLFYNTMIVGVVSTILSLIITVLSAFAFARLEFKGRETMFAALLATMMIPGELFTITNYSTVTSFGWMNTYTVLIVPFLVSVFYIFLLRQNSCLLLHVGGHCRRNHGDNQHADEGDLVPFHGKIKIAVWYRKEVVYTDYTACGKQKPVNIAVRISCYNKQPQYIEHCNIQRRVRCNLLKYERRYGRS